MGSKPSKTVKGATDQTLNGKSGLGLGNEQGSVQDANGHKPAEDESDDSANEEDAAIKTIRIDKNTPMEEIRSRVEEIMDFVNASHDFSERGILTKLGTISKMYYVLKRTRREDLKAACRLLLDKNLLTLFCRMWDVFHENREEFYENRKSVKWKILRKMKIILQNYGDKCPELAQECYKDGQIIQRFMSELTFPELSIEKLRNVQKRTMVKATFGILINLLRHCNSNKVHVRKDNGLEKLLAYEKSTFLIIKAEVYIILAHCINEDESDKVTTGEGVIKFIVKLLSSAVSSANHVAKSYSFSAEETLVAINKLASSDENKLQIVDAGILPLLNKLLQDDVGTSKNEHFEAVNCLWTLAFHPDNKEKILAEPGLTDAVIRLKNKSDTESSDKLSKACSSTLFVLGVEEIPESKTQKSLQNSKHVMISYNWEVQQTMFEIRDFLKQAGYDVWMDVDNMQDSILSAMAEAVENSALILIAMTDSYKNSNPCRTEAEYAYRRAVPILPLLLQSGYMADGWLGAMVGTKLYVDLSKGFSDEKCEEMRRQIGNIAVMEKAVSNPADNKRTSSSVVKFPKSIRGGDSVLRADITCITWSKDEVQKWYNAISLDERRPLPPMDGNSLAQLCKMLVRSPDNYYSVVRQDIRLNVQDMLSFTSAIESLLLS